MLPCVQGNEPTLFNIYFFFNVHPNFIAKVFSVHTEVIMTYIAPVWYPSLQMNKDRLQIFGIVHVKCQYDKKKVNIAPIPPAVYEGLTKFIVRKRCMNNLFL